MKKVIVVILALILIMAFIFRLMRMGDNQRETFGRVYCYIVASILLFHTLINIGMTMGLVPVMGIPLPLVSYGGSSMVAMFAAMGLVSGVKFKLKPQLFSIY